LKAWDKVKPWLVGSPPPEEAAERDGFWPSPSRQAVWDLLPARWVPGQSGLKAPKYEQPDWLNDPTQALPEAANQAQRAHEREIDRVRNSEEKGARLAQNALLALALAFTVGGFELSAVRGAGGGVRYLLLVPIAAAISFLVLAALEAIETDRVGLYLFPTSKELIGEANAIRAQVQVEERARWMADWTATKKLNQLLQARAWLSRGVLLLVISAILGVFIHAPEPKENPIVVRITRTGHAHLPTKTAATTLVTPTKPTAPPTN
jgi:hypothetical protein